MCNSCAHPFPLPSTESVQSSSADGTPTSEWVLTGVIGSNELVTTQRLTKLEEIRQRKTEHGETTILPLQHHINTGSLNFLTLPTYNSPLPLPTPREILTVTKTFSIKPYYLNTFIHYFLAVRDEYEKLK